MFQVFVQSQIFSRSRVLKAPLSAPAPQLETKYSKEIRTSQQPRRQQQEVAPSELAAANAKLSAASASSLLLTSNQQYSLQKELPAALLASVAVHGWVNKTGITSPKQWHSAHQPRRDEAFARWHALPTQQAPPPVAVPACQIFYNPDYKFIYLRTPKVASSSLLKHFGLCDGSLGEARPWCLRPLPEGISAPQAQRLWEESFVFGLTRSPFSRAISAYRFLAQKVTDVPGCGDGVTWDNFCSNPAFMAGLCR
jgi:hypothetical protein